VRPFPHPAAHERSLTPNNWRLSLAETRALVGAGGGRSITARVFRPVTLMRVRTAADILRRYFLNRGESSRCRMSAYHALPPSLPPVPEVGLDAQEAVRATYTATETCREGSWGFKDTVTGW
jgi:hypothetical protein